MSFNFNEVPEYDPIEGGAGEGPGIDAENLQVVKTSHVTDLDLAVLGFLILPSTFHNVEENNATHYASVHLAFPDGKEYLWRTSAAAILRKLKIRWELDQIPFKTTIVLKPNKRGNREYLDFTR